MSGEIIVEEGKKIFLHGKHQYEGVGNDEDNRILAEHSVQGFRPISEFYAVYRMVARCKVCGRTIITNEIGYI